MTTRRSFLASILSAGMAPAAIGSGILMPIKKIVVPEQNIWIGPWHEELIWPKRLFENVKEHQREKPYNRYSEDVLETSVPIRFYFGRPADFFKIKEGLS